jgi:hypothetical protein
MWTLSIYSVLSRRIGAMKIVGNLPSMIQGRSNDFRASSHNACHWWQVGVTHYCSTWKARQELGYIALVDAKEGMHRTVAYWKELHSRELPSPPLLVWIGILAGMFLLFLCAFVPAPFMGPLECVRSLAFFLFRTQNIMRIGFYMACLAHLVEGGYAWILARKVDPSNATGWWLQTSVVGFPSLRLLLQKARHQRNKKQK